MSVPANRLARPGANDLVVIANQHSNTHRDLPECVELDTLQRINYTTILIHYRAG